MAAHHKPSAFTALIPEMAIAFLRRLRNDSLLRNSLFIMATGAIGSALGYVYWILAARLYTASEVGLVSALISAMMLTSTLTLLGFGSTLVQMLPKKRSGEEWSLTINAALIGASLTGLVGGLVAVGILLLSPQFADLVRNTAYIAVFLVSIPLWTVATLVDAVFTAERATDKMLVRNMIFSILKIVLLVLLLPMQVGGLGVFLAWVLAVLLALAASYSLIRRLGRDYYVALNGVISQTRQMFSALVGHHFINISGAAPMYLLPVFVTARLSAADNAYFYTTWMIGAQFSMISVSVAVSLFAEGSHTEKDIVGQMKRCFWLLTAIFIPMMVVFVLFGKPILGIFGSTYSEKGWPLLMLLVAAAIPDATTSVYISMLRVMKRLRSAALLNTSMTIITLALAWILLPIFGIVGVGVAWLIGQSIGTIAAILDYATTRRMLAPVPEQIAETAL